MELSRRNTTSWTFEHGVVEVDVRVEVEEVVVADVVCDDVGVVVVTDTVVVWVLVGEVVVAEVVCDDVGVVVVSAAVVAWMLVGEVVVGDAVGDGGWVVSDVEGVAGAVGLGATVAAALLPGTVTVVGDGGLEVAAPVGLGASVGAAVAPPAVDASVGATVIDGPLVVALAFVLVAAAVVVSKATVCSVGPTLPSVTRAGVAPAAVVVGSAPGVVASVLVMVLDPADRCMVLDVVRTSTVVATSADVAARGSVVVLPSGVCVCGAMVCELVWASNVGVAVRTVETPAIVLMPVWPGSELTAVDACPPDGVGSVSAADVAALSAVVFAGGAGLVESMGGNVAANVDVGVLVVSKAMVVDDDSRCCVLPVSRTAVVGADVAVGGVGGFVTAVVVVGHGKLCCTTR